MHKIPNKQSEDIYALYTDYDSDYRGSYSLIIRCEVKNLENVPQGMTAKSVQKSKYAIFTAEGKFPESLIDTWTKIWTSPIQRSYQTDFEIYSEKCRDLENPPVEIYISLKLK